MMVGNPAIFAIESEITIAYADLGARALGYFIIHIGGQCYGVRSPDATWLACSFDEVKERLNERGRHLAPFSVEPEAGRIADAFRDAIYAPNQDAAVFFGLVQNEFSRHIYDQHIAWAPDGDEAFDDGSYILQFDLGERVRLIAFKSCETGYHHDPTTLSDVWLDVDEFYRIIEEWSDRFEAEWQAAPKQALGI